MKRVREIIREVLSVFAPAVKLSKNLSKLISQEISARSKSIEEFPYAYDFSIPYASPGYFFESTSIRKISINYIFYKDKNNKNSNQIGGAYKEDKLNQFNEGGIISYDTEISIKFYNWDYRTDLTKQIESVISHELLHAMEDIKKYNKKTPSKVINNVKSQLKLLYSNELANEPLLKQFVDLIYFNLPQERNAMVQQCFVDIQEHKNKSFNEIILELGKIVPFKDFLSLWKFNADEILKNVPEEKLVQFVGIFNRTFQQQKDKLGFEELKGYSLEPKSFFLFWQKQFNKNGEESRRKVLKMVADIKNIKIDENSLMYAGEILNENSMSIVYGFKLNETN